MADWTALGALSKLFADVRSELVRSFATKPNLLVPSARLASSLGHSHKFREITCVNTGGLPLVNSTPPVSRAPRMSESVRSRGTLSPILKPVVCPGRDLLSRATINLSEVP